MIMETKIEEMLGIVESKNVKVISATYSDIYKNVTIKINDTITSINYADDGTAEVRTTDTIYMSDKQFNFIIDRLYGDELTLLNDMFFGGNLSIKSTCVLLKGATFDVDSTIVPTEHGTMPYRVDRSFKNGKLDRNNVKATISFVKDI